MDFVCKKQNTSNENLSINNGKIEQEKFTETLPKDVTFSLLNLLFWILKKQKKLRVGEKEISC